MSRLLYSLGWWLATPLVVLYLLWRARKQPEYLGHWRERWGWHPRRRDDGPLVWVHAVSVGETRAAQPLVAALLARDPSLRILLTHMTPTGRQTGEELFAKRHGARIVQAYLPYDYPFATRRFLRAWRPAIGLVMETELWPNLCASARADSVPLALVNARLSEKSLRKGRRWRALMAPALRSLCRVVAQTEADAARIRSLGRDAVDVAGNMKFDVDAPEPMLARGRDWRARLGGRGVVLAASTRDGEEVLLLDAWQRAGSASLLAIVPRHPQRFDAVADAITRRGFRLVRRSSLDAAGAPSAAPSPAPAPADDTGTTDDTGAARAAGQCGRADVLLGDSMGEMFAYYGLADVAIIGGSLLPFGGQNLIEACAAGVPVVLGPHTYNFADAADQAIRAGAALRVDDAAAAVECAREWLDDEVARDAVSRRATAFAAAHRGATARTVALIERWLP